MSPYSEASIPPPPVAVTVAPEKRLRAKPPLPKTVLKIVTINNKNRFVCEVTGKLIDRRISIPSYEANLSFINIPAAVYYIREKTRDNEQKGDELVGKLAKKYNQLDDLPQSPSPSLLEQFGGTLPYDHWIGDLSKWDEFTQQKGETVDQYKRSKNTKKRQKKAKVEKFSFESKTYMVHHTSTKRKAIYETVDVVRAIRKQQAFITRQRKEGKIVQRSLASSKNCEAIILTCDDLPAKNNELAHRITGSNCVGPALIFVTRKFSVNID